VIVLLTLLVAAFGLLAALIGLALLRGWDPSWAAGWRHAWHEAGYRAGGLWSEFLDWLRSS
jgi:hypothetical protein